MIRIRNKVARTDADTAARRLLSLWYPALIFALAGVAALRLDCRFTTRSAIIATTVVAVTLGMAVIL